MTGPMTTQQLREQLRADLDAVPVPPGDLEAVRRRARNGRHHRRAAAGVGLAAAVIAAALVVTQTGPGRLQQDRTTPEVTDSTGTVDLSEGLRAFAEPGGNLYMAGATLPDALDRLDTDAAATPYGIVHYDADGSPWLLRPDGERVQLDEGTSDTRFAPTVKADALRPHVAYATLRADELTLVVYDLEDRSVVADHVISCPEGCDDRVIDGIDSGAVFLRGKDGTTVWDYEQGERTFFAGPDTRVADVRNGVVLYDGPRPAEEIEGWRYVSGAIDAQLTFDGQHVLYWDDELTSTALRGTSVIKLDLPVQATFFAIDTDGSVLAATVNDPSKVFDCEIPSGECEQVGEMDARHGDPMFIGTDR